MSVPPAGAETVSRSDREGQPTLAFRADSRWPARAAATFAFASASVTLFWTLGGTLLLDTVGGAPEEIARRHTLGSFAFGAAVVLVKVTAGLLALALLGRAAAGPRRRMLLFANGAASALLILWGGANVLIGGLVLADVITPAGSVDEYGLRWHVFFWDAWFLVWGAILALAVARRLRATS